MPHSTTSADRVQGKNTMFQSQHRGVKMLVSRNRVRWDSYSRMQYKHCVLKCGCTSKPLRRARLQEHCTSVLMISTLHDVLQRVQCPHPCRVALSVVPPRLISILIIRAPVQVTAGCGLVKAHTRITVRGNMQLVYSRVTVR